VYQGSETAQSIRRPFNDYLQDWESFFILNKNVYFYHADADEDHNSDVYCAVNIEWHRLSSPGKRKAGMRSQNQIVTICVACYGKPVMPRQMRMSMKGT
jgi:hypothetical protein